MFNIGNASKISETQEIINHYKKNNERGESFEVDDVELEDAMACSETLPIEQNLNQIIDETSSQYQPEKNTGN